MGFAIEKTWNFCLNANTLNILDLLIAFLVISRVSLFRHDYILHLDSYFLLLKFPWYLQSLFCLP